MEQDKEINVFNILFSGKHLVKRWQIVKDKCLDTNLLEHQYIAYYLYNDFCRKYKKQSPSLEIINGILLHDIGEIRPFNKDKEIKELNEFLKRNSIEADEEVLHFVYNEMENCDFPFQMKKTYPYLKKYCDEQEEKFLNNLHLDNTELEKKLEIKNEVKKADILANLFDIKEEYKLQKDKSGVVDEEFIKGIERLFNMKQVIEDDDLKQYMKNFLNEN